GGQRLQADLRAAAEGLRGSTSLDQRLQLAIILSTLRDRSASTVAQEATAIAPTSAKAWLIRARVDHHAGDRDAALEAVERGLLLEPDDPRFLALRGQLHTERGHPEEGLADLERAGRLGAGAIVGLPRSEALLALGRPESAIDACSAALAIDPEDPRSYHNRA